MLSSELIRKKRDGGTLSREELHDLIDGYLHGTIPDYQMSAFLMAVFFRGMTFEETTVLTDLMLHSGTVVDLSSIPGIKVDKHSTGGVGDKVSLVLAPMVAACGVPVPMISGRGLGHTGGTLDKLESIPGFRTDLSVDEYTAVIRDTGLVMIGQTKEIAPADKRLYALRDVTATVESIPLISASILSKKLAEGIDSLVLDVKTGRGAFMQREENSIALAKTLVAIGTNMGKRTVGFITSMDEPLGVAVGNWLEVVESVHCLQGGDSSDLMEVTYVLGGAMVMLGGWAPDIASGIAMCRDVIRSGAAYERFLALVARQGGDTSFIENLEKYPISLYTIPVTAAEDGVIQSIDSLEIGLTAIELGAGRSRVDDAIDSKAGIVFKRHVNDRVEIGETLAVIYTDRGDILTHAADRIQKAFRLGAREVEKPPMIRHQVDAGGVQPFRPGG
ncbi:MAG: thymidine phosphorylase [Ignavibacteriales bacterium CG07_land_8_20_14_0_80_59_12]|nr:MAG: thymidine phosphorylase [Ignavibacteriales bacterium CG07_land_8_20_14_0_80_59_12]